MSGRYLPVSVRERWTPPGKEVAVLHVVDCESEDAKAADSIERLVGTKEAPTAMCGGKLEGSLSIGGFEERCPECSTELSKRGQALLYNPDTKTVIAVVSQFKLRETSL